MSVCPLANSNIIADSPQAPPLLFFFFFFFFAARAAHRQRRVLVFPQINDLARRRDVLWAFLCLCLFLFLRLARGVLPAVATAVGVTLSFSTWTQLFFFSLL